MFLQRQAFPEIMFFSLHFRDIMWDDPSKLINALLYSLCYESIYFGRLHGNIGLRFKIANRRLMTVECFINQRIWK